MTVTLTDEQALDTLDRLAQIDPEDYEGTELAQMKALVDQLLPIHEDDPLIREAMELVIGPEKVPAGSVERHGTYIDTFYPSLTGKTAIVFEITDDGALSTGKHVIAQFDDHATGYAWGWHWFGPNDFKLDEPRRR